MPPEQPMPADPMTVLAEGAAQLHEAFRAYVAAGFTEEQAMRVVLQIVAVAMGKG